MSLVSWCRLLSPPLLAAADPPPELVWAGDPEGGAPFVEADPSHPDRVVGFEVEIADLLARGLGRTARFLNITFTTLHQSIARGDADLGLNGIEDTPARRATLATTIPYYRFREVLSVRPADAQRFRTLADLRGRRVGDARRHDRLRNPARAPNASTGCSRSRTTTTCIRIRDLLLGRVDAVLLDNVLAERRR